MKVIPAVDISGGKCVRLRRGRLEDATVYYDDPLEAARRWEGEGAELLHV
ncbi:MAG: HisA/HisF-related TIM barrel protein, partial [Candidatus Methanomethylicia archaeon]|nr:HisA/HisF-related TIM barrel protein [Candidatus Methanomethylicia archaeon]